MKIFKYELTNRTLNTLKLPPGSKPLSVQVQYAGTPAARICLWAQVDPGAAATQEFFIWGLETGRDMPDHVLQGGRFLGTVLMDGGRLVVHYYVTEKGPKKC